MRRPHVLGIDDAPFVKGQQHAVPIVGVMMEGATLVEGGALGAFPVDGAGATDYLVGWVASQPWRRSLHGVVLGGITIAGLGLVDIAALSAELGVPVLVATRRDPAASTLGQALRAAGFDDRLAVLERTPAARALATGLYVAWAGTDAEGAEGLVRAAVLKSKVPEPLRVAHLIGAALVRGVSRGRV